MLVVANRPCIIYLQLVLLEKNLSQCNVSLKEKAKVEVVYLTVKGHIYVHRWKHDDNI